MYTAHTWDLDQADRYDGFLAQSFRDLAERPEIGQAVEERQGLRCFVVRWPGAQYGHRIIYAVTENGIDIVRVLHTAMNWMDHI
jgi:plasmid stabilization system protein ParE